MGMLRFELMIDREENLPDGISSINASVQQGFRLGKNSDCIAGDHSVLSCEEQSGAIDFLISRDFLTRYLFSQCTVEGS